MIILYDFVKLFLESNLLAARGEGFWKWAALASVVACATLLLTSYFCRLWNRHYVFGVWHRISFSAASLLAFIAILAWPASVNVEAAVKRRVEVWKEHLFKPDEVMMKQEWKNTLKSLGVPIIPEKTSWFHALPLKTRDNFKERGISEGIIILEDLEDYEKWEPTYFFGKNDLEADYFKFSEAIRNFMQTNPYLGSRLNFDFTGRFEEDKAKITFVNYLAKYSSKTRLAFDRKSGKQVSRISDRAGADALAWAIESKLVPKQTKWLAEWTRKAGVTILSLSVGLPVLISGILSYSQIRVGHNRRRPTSINEAARSKGVYRRRHSNRD